VLGRPELVLDVVLGRTVEDRGGGLLALLVDLALALIQRLVVSPGLTGRYGKVQPFDSDTGASTSVAPAPALQHSV